MEQNRPKIMRGALTEACGMWAPIIPPAGDPKASVDTQDIVPAPSLNETPVPIALSSIPTARTAKKA